MAIIMIQNKQNLKCGLLGEHLRHSFSPIIHSYLADYSYALFEKEKEDVKDFLKSDLYDAINVTIPYKKTVIPYLDKLSPEAQSIGAVNTITKDSEGRLCGNNTDYYGFEYLVKKSKITLKDKNILIIGAGGASTTANAVSKDMGAGKVTVISRKSRPNYEEIQQLFHETQVIINCSPVGMYPKNLISPLSLEKFTACCGVIDMIYNPAKTKLLLDAEHLAIPCINGLSMLTAQAKRACELFLNEKIDNSEIDRITDIINKKTRNIVLVGMPGSGKSTVGNIIAEKMSRPFYDTDEEIVKNTGQVIPKIFENEGENTFRIYENRAVCSVGKMSGCVISTGGGVVTREINLEPLAQNSLIFFIKRDISAIPTDNRPLSQKNSLADMFSKRLPMYKYFCDFEVGNDSTPEECAEKIISLFNSHAEAAKRQKQDWRSI